MRLGGNKNYFYWGLTAFLVILASLVATQVIFQFDVVWGSIRRVIKILNPVFYGIIIAYLLDPAEKLFYRLASKIFKKTTPRNMTAAKLISVSASFVLALLIFFFFLLIILPQFVKSLISLFENMGTYYQGISDWTSRIVEDNTSLRDSIQTFSGDIYNVTDKWWRETMQPYLTSTALSLTGNIISVIFFFIDFILGMITSVYLLYNKRKFLAQLKKMTYALFSVKFANKILAVSRHTNKVFNRYISGMLLEALIVGTLMFMFMQIAGFPLAVLISVAIGISNLIPIFGTYIAGIPCALLLFLDDPWKALWFVIYLLVLKQIDGSFIGPKIIGGAIGISGFWIIFAILLFGGLFGVFGMTVGVPAFAVIYVLIGSSLKKRLYKRDLPRETEDYVSIAGIDENTHKTFDEDRDEFE